MKRDITDFMSKCPICQHVKVEHQKQRGMTQEIDIPTWKWDVINMDFSLFGGQDYIFGRRLRQDLP